MKTQMELQQIKKEILNINALSKYSSSGEIIAKQAMDIVSEIQIIAGGEGLKHLRNSDAIETRPNDFIASIADSVSKYGRCSEKQAYCLAKYAYDNQDVINFEKILS